MLKHADFGEAFPVCRLVKPAFDIMSSVCQYWPKIAFCKKPKRAEDQNHQTGVTRKTRKLGGRGHVLSLPTGSEKPEIIKNASKFAVSCAQNRNSSATTQASRRFAVAVEPKAILHLTFGNLTGMQHSFVLFLPLSLVLFCFSS